MNHTAERFFSKETVKLANSISPFKVRQVKFCQKAGLREDKMYFSQKETECS